jgi:hypothetical protein
MVFINPIMATHGNRIVDQPLMSSMVIRRCKNVNVVHSRGGYREPIAVTIPIFDHRYGHYARPNRVAFKYPNFKKNVNPNVHVRMFNFAKTFEEYIINAFSYTLRDTASN